MLVALSVLILILVLAVYGRVDNRFTQIERYLAHIYDSGIILKSNEIEKSLTALQRSLDVIEERLNDLKSKCAPLDLLNLGIFDAWGIEMEERTKVKKLREIDRIEKEELLEYEKKYADNVDFQPSDHLKSQILAVSSAIVICRTLGEELDLVRKLFFDALSGRKLIEEVQQESAKLKQSFRKEIDDMENTLYSPEYHIETIETNIRVHPKVKEEYKESFAWHKERWVGDQWKKRLEYLLEMESDEDIF